MDLLKLIKPAQDAVDAQLARIATREHRCDDRESAVDGREEAVGERETANSEWEASLKVRESKVLGAEKEEARISELKTLIKESGDKLTLLNKTAKDQADIWATIKQQQTDLATREKSLSDEKATYKESIKKAFYEEVQKGLPH